MRFIDSHCHIHFKRIVTILPTLLNESVSKGITHYVVNSTSPADFDLVSKLCEDYTYVTPCYGIHPHYIEALSIEDSLSQLYKQCNNLNKSYCIGEIGMDKTVISNIPFDIQEQVFRKQIQFALSKSVPFIVHCVHCISRVYDVLKSEILTPSPFLMHGYSGSADYVNRFVVLGGYFSISNYFLNLSPKRRKGMEDTIRKIPLDRILFESDAPDMVVLSVIVDIDLQRQHSYYSVKR